MGLLVDVVLLTLLVAVTLAVSRMLNLYAAVMLFGIFSLLTAALFVVLDAVDVALTEAVVGAGAATILLIATVALTRSQARPARRGRLPALAAALITGGLLLYGTADLPRLGDPQSGPNSHVAPRYTQESMKEIGVPNLVTAVLASYRGWDTLGEVVVIFAAGVGVIAVMRRRPRRRDGEG
jgi:multicomponent Na+:H+ antiporter subunit B